ncbi:MAG: DUF362 domain-containing protein [Nitrospirota bacterium]
MNTIYLTSARAERWDYRYSMPGKLETLLRHVDITKYFEEDEWVAVKTHFGSEGAHRVIRPVFIRKIVDAIKNTGAKPFVTDTVRIKGIDYLEVANINGINHLSCGAPVILADGLYGNDNILVPAGEILGEVAVASVIYDVPAMVVCSHIKGHIQAGYGGAIKNVSMGGMSSRHRVYGWEKGRGSVHTFGEGKLDWNKDKCTLCLQCQYICPLQVIIFEGEVFTYNEEDCWRCGRCTRVCPESALMLPSDDERFQKALAESAKAVLSTFKDKKVIYINFLTEIQPECDCMPVADVPVIQDQGILLSDDIVAIEQATVDILKRAFPLPQSVASDKGIAAGEDVLGIVNPRPYQMQIDEAERLGLGIKEYTLVEIGR